MIAGADVLRFGTRLVLVVLESDGGWVAKDGITSWVGKVQPGSRFSAAAEAAEAAMPAEIREEFEGDIFAAADPRTGEGSVLELVRRGPQRGWRDTGIRFPSRREAIEYVEAFKEKVRVRGGVGEHQAV